MGSLVCSHYSLLTLSKSLDHCIEQFMPFYNRNSFSLKDIWKLSYEFYVVKFSLLIQLWANPKVQLGFDISW